MENKRYTLTKPTIALGVTGAIVVASVGTASAIGYSNDMPDHPVYGQSDQDPAYRNGGNLDSRVHIPGVDVPRGQEQTRGHMGSVDDRQLGDGQRYQSGVRDMAGDRDRLRNHRDDQTGMMGMMDRDRDRDRLRDQTSEPRVDRPAEMGMGYRN